MAYAAVETQRRQSGRFLTITIEETDAQASSETPGIVIPRSGKILRVQSTLVSGTAATVRPSAYHATGGANADNIWVDAGAAAAAFIDDATSFGYMADSALMFLKTGADAGTDNVVTTTVLIETD